MAAENFVTFGMNSYIAPTASVDLGSKIGDESIVDERCRIGRQVIIGNRVQIMNDCLILDFASICPNDVYSKSSNAREIGSRSSIGPGVLIHDEAELDNDAIIPTQRTIATLGNLGSKNRVVTIYGSFAGPLYSVGCQIGVTYLTLTERVSDATATTPQSANTYEPYLDILNSIGTVVQEAYDQESGLIEEIKAMRRELGMYTV